MLRPGPAPNGSPAAAFAAICLGLCGLTGHAHGLPEGWEEGPAGQPGGGFCRPATGAGQVTYSV
ncbi:MAG: hypothetical protein AVDCRST_MAG56-4624 [uncultured Cytophagales bacterium]|uniref:Uncharacterized protein n=1 Tax=uncultured Cytophagales bacterium TaxID=158755 RepID=A0A6J4JZ62_9SPHI|nr:MAG: hypothetical protein AVDCRST_MAG56-4624 [uncultured Cytophagales bacterium]